MTNFPRNCITVVCQFGSPPAFFMDGTVQLQATEVGSWHATMIAAEGNANTLIGQLLVSKVWQYFFTLVVYYVARAEVGVEWG